MKKHFYAFLVMISFLTLALYANQAQAQFKYCKPTFSAGGCNGYDVSGFSLGSFSSSPTCTSTGYDTSGLSGTGIVVYRGKTYSMTISGGTGESYAAYIDYQHDGSFEDIGDFVGDDDNNSYSSITQNVTIPLSSKPVVTRMRVIAANTTSLNYNTDCGSYGSGSCVDYKLTITAFPYDIGILALTPAYCPTAKEPVQVIIQNVGLNTLKSIPFTFKVGSTTVSSTYNRSLASNTQDTFTIGFFNASTAGTYSLQIYSSLSNDGDRTNDSITATLHIAQPAAPKVTANISHCGPGSPFIDGASTTASSFTNWYTTDTGTVPFAKHTDSIQAPFLTIGSSLTYYAQSVFNTNNSITKGSWSTARTNYGNMFDVFTKNTIIVDSLDVNFAGTGTGDSAALYYRVGTYSGYQNDPTAWVHFATVPVVLKGGGNPTRVALPRPLKLPVGTTFGFYTVPVPASVGTNYDITYSSSNPLSNADMTITAGCSLASLFGTSTQSRDWNGTIYYHLDACPSPRVSTTITMLQNPNGATLSKGVPFQGNYNKGDEVHSDQVCVGDTIKYMITPPTGMAESDYGTKWVVNSMSLKTVRGFVSKDTSSRMPTKTTAGYIRFIPTIGDSVFVLSVDMKTPGTGCDSVMQRYITASNNPTANFSFANPCGNVAVLLKSLSTVKSTTDTVKTWSWNYGDGTGTSTRQVPYPYKYANPGTYKVTLAVTSSAGCPATISKSLTEYPVPVAKFGSKVLCNNRPVTMLDSSTIASPDKLASWSWNFGDGNKSTSQNPVHTYAKSGPYNLKLVVATNNGCMDSLTKAIRVEPIPVPKFSFVDKCVNAPIYMSTSGTIDSSSKLGTYTWTYGDGTAPTAVANHTYKANGTYNIKLLLTTMYGCSDSVTHPITPNAVTVPKITYNLACVGKTVRFTDSSGATSSTYSWRYGDLTSNLGVDSNREFHVYKDTGTYIVWLTIQNGSNCIDSAFRKITIPGYPKATFSAANVCVGNATIFKNTTATSNVHVFTWNFGDGSALSNIPNPTYKYAAAGTYTVELTATSAYGCADSTSQTVNVNPLPVVNAWKYGTTISHYVVNFIPADTTIGTFKWYFGDPANDSSSLKKPTFTYSSAAGGGKYQVKLVVTNSYGCVSTRTDSVFTGKFNGIEVTGTTFDGITVYPNPFQGTTNISYALPEKSTVNIKVYNMEGRLVATLKDGQYGAGNYITTFDARKYNAAEGVYYLKMYINDQYYTTKIVNTK